MRMGPAGKWGIKHMQKLFWSRSESEHARLIPAQMRSLSHTFSRKGREGAEDTTLSTLEHQLESGRDAPGPHVAAHTDLVEHAVQELHETAEENPTWKRAAWHCWLFVIAQTPSIKEKFSWDKSGENVSRGGCWVMASKAFAKTSCHCWDLSLGQDPVWWHSFSELLK